MEFQFAGLLKPVIKVGNKNKTLDECTLQEVIEYSIKMLEYWEYNSHPNYLSRHIATDVEDYIRYKAYVNDDSLDKD